MRVNINTFYTPPLIVTHRHSSPKEVNPVYRKYLSSVIYNASEKVRNKKSPGITGAP